MNGKHFIGNQQLSRKLIGRTKEALRQRNVQFAQAHGDASDEALLIMSGARRRALAAGRM